MDPNIDIPDEVKHIVKERTSIWQSLDIAKTKAKQLDQYPNKFGGMMGQTIDVPRPFIDGNDPIQEVEYVIQELDRQANELVNTQQEIQSAQREIVRLEARDKSRRTMAILGVVGAVILCLVIVAGVGMVIAG